jgi:DNA-binding HxlR family transcriptional regulator
MSRLTASGDWTVRYDERVLPSTYDQQNCSIARALELVGERWTMLILRDAFLGVRRFDDFQARLEISRTVLAGRLSDLTHAGLLHREPYQERPPRYDYLPTERALELWPTLVGLGQWGARHACPGGPPREFIHQQCGHTLSATVRCPHCDVEVDPGHADSQPGPGYLPRPYLPAPLRSELARRRPLLEPMRSSPSSV